MIELPLSNGLFAIVDDDDAPMVAGIAWSAHPKISKTGRRLGWYAAANIGGKTVYMHRRLLDAPIGILVDRRDGDGLHNWRDNLRLGDHQLNNVNRHYCAAIGFRGVHPHRRLWRAQLEARGTRYRSVLFADPADAAREYDRLAFELFGEAARLNFPVLA